MLSSGPLSSLPPGQPRSGDLDELCAGRGALPCAAPRSRTGMSSAYNHADMHARFAIALLAALGLVSGNALTARNDRSLEAANPVRPSPGRRSGSTVSKSCPVRLRRSAFGSDAGSSMTRGSRGMAPSRARHATYPNGRSPTGHESQGVRVDMPVFAKRRRSSTPRTRS